MLAPICKREKSSIQSRGFFLPEASLPALDGGVDRLSTKAFTGQTKFVPYQHRRLTLPSQFFHWGRVEMHQG